MNNQENIKFIYIKTPLNKYTFKSPRIKEWVEKNVEGKVLNLFSGLTKLNCNEVRNDIRKEMNAKFHKDALKFVNEWKGDKFNTILLDPPYSYRKSMEMYGGRITSPFNALKDSLLKILTINGLVITFGYHSNVMGKIRGFHIEQICLMSHGGAIHDTIATIERRKSCLIKRYPKL
uniref:Putative methyltransferase n=1 Tax=viral metagenome TaxID=1070528 RepID=A0A6M3L4K8_9ZZZZ